MNGVQLYFRYIGISIRAQMQYRASFWMLILANLFGMTIEYVSIFSFFDRFGGLAGWSLPEIALLYAMANAAFSCCEAWMRGFNKVDNIIRQGEFDRVLLRPRSTVLQILGGEVQVMRLARLVVGVAIAAWAIGELGIQWALSHWLLLIFSVLGGGLLFSGIILLRATSCFWTVETLEVFNMFTYGGTEVAQYPLSIYHEWFKRFFMYILPLAAINYWPCSVLLGKGYVSAWLAYFSPLVGPLFFGVCVQVWRFGVRHYRSTGS